MVKLCVCTVCQFGDRSGPCPAVGHAVQGLVRLSEHRLATGAGLDEHLPGGPLMRGPVAGTS